MTRRRDEATGGDSSQKAESTIGNFGLNQCSQPLLALLKLLALGQQEEAAGKVKPVAEVVARLRAKRASNRNR
jgi:hypothetical protein